VNAIRTVLVAAVLGLAGCSTATPGPAASPSASSAAPAAAAGFGGTDLAWIEISLAMDEQVRPLLDLVPTHSKDSDIQALALQIKAFTDAELATLRQLRDRGGLPTTNAHQGMPMPGIVTADQVAQAAKLTGPKFDEAALQQIKGYLEQGRNLARSESKSGVEPQTRELALQVLRNREQALPTAQKAH
jgi:uncharacterized protein (DUF305 family)